MESQHATEANVPHRASRLQTWLASKGYATLVVAFAMFTDAFIYDLVVPCLPEILRERFSVQSIEVQTWISASLAAYGVAFVLSPPFAGWWTDRCREKRIPFMAGFVALGASTLMFFVGTSLAALIAARAFQGLSAALVWVSGLALLTSSIKDGGIGTVIGYVTVGTSLGELTGPLVGGIIYDVGGHWSVCAVASTVVGVDIVLRAFLREHNDQTKISIPDEQGPLIAGNQPRQIYDATKNQHAAEEARTRHEIRVGLEPQRSLTPKNSFSNLLGDPNFLGSLFAVLVGSIIRTALESALPLYTSTRFHLSTSYTGLVILAFILPNIAGSYIGDLAERHGPRTISIVSCGCLSACFVILGLIRGEDIGSVIGFCITILLSGVGESFLLTSHMVAISMAAARISKVKGGGGGGQDANTSSAEGRAFACMNLAYGGGMLLGPLWAAGVLRWFDWRVLCFSSTGLAALTGALLGVRSRHWDEMGI